MKREDFPGQPEDALPLLPDMPQPGVEPRFDPLQRRAFGSVPRLLGAKLDIPKFERLDTLAWERTKPENISAGLIGRPDGGTVVDGLVLSPEEYQAIMRSPGRFLTSVQVRTMIARRNRNDISQEEGVLKSGYESFESKRQRQATVISGLETERSCLRTLLTEQKAPAYPHTKQVDLVLVAHQTLQTSILPMLHTLKQQHGLSPEEHIDTHQALMYRLFRGPQNSRMKSWGDVMHVADDYVAAKISLFNNRQNIVTRIAQKLQSEQNDFYIKHGISPR